MRTAPLALLIALSGCPQKPAQPTSVVPPGVGCPTASNVYLASYVQPPEKQQGYAGWALPLHNVVVDSVEGKPPFAAIDPQAATTAGVPTPPQNVWLLPPNAPMCKATIGGYYAEAIDATTKNMSYGVTLSGCPAPQDPNDAGVAIAMVSVEPPSECQPLAARPVASRVGTSAQTGEWSRPTKETAMPEAFAKLVPERACAAPDCEKLWTVAQVDHANKPIVVTGAVNWLEIPPGAAASTQCTWKTETYSGFFTVGADGALTKVTEGQQHPMSLFVVLVDKAGPKAIIADGTGEYSTYDFANGTATLARNTVWLIDDPQAYGQSDHIGPECNSGP